MLNLWRTTRPIFGCSKRHFRSHSKFGNRNRSGLTKRALSTLQSASASNFTITPLLLLGGAIGAGLSTVVYVTQRPETRPSAEEEETPALTPQPAKLSHMSPDSLFIVGSASYPGKTDGNAMLIPHQVRRRPPF